MGEGGLMIYVRDNIPRKMLTKHDLLEDIEATFIELNFWKCKWLLYSISLLCSPFQNYNSFLDSIHKV